MKKFFKKLMSSKKKRLGAAVAVLVILAAYFIISMLSVSRAEISLEKLRRSFDEDYICHEACSAARASESAQLARELADRPEARGARRLRAYFLDEKKPLDFRLSLLAIIRQAFGPDNPPAYVPALMGQRDNPEIRAEILTIFSPSSLGAVGSALDYYYDILAGNDDLAVKLAALRALSSLDNKEYLADIGRLEQIKRLVFDSRTDKRLRQSLILLLGDYYLFLPSETKGILSAFCQTETASDNISRAFAADILNRLGGESLIIPAIEAAEWDEYYND